MRSTRPILLVEDDQVDIMTVRRAMREAKIANQINVAANGEEALAYLHDPANRRPCIVLLDLNMPRMGGIEFLSIIKQDAILKRIPVVVFTSSREEQDRLETFNQGIAGYMTKPVNYKDVVEIVRVMDHYWTLSEFPDEDNHD